MQKDLEAVWLKKIALSAEGYLELNLPQRSLAEIQKVSDAKLSFTPNLLYLEGASLYRMKKYRDALYPLGQASLLEPHDIRIWLMIALCQKRVGRCDLAIVSLENALCTEPNSTVVLYNIACYHALAKHAEKCIKYLKRCLFLDPKFKRFVENEPDFNFIRNSEEFRDILCNAEMSIQKSQSQR